MRQVQPAAYLLRRPGVSKVVLRRCRARCRRIPGQVSLSVVSLSRVLTLCSASQLANSLIQKVSGGSYEGFNTKEEADAAYERAKAAGVVRKVTPEGSVAVL